MLNDGCAFSVAAEGYPFGPSGLCAMPAMAALGITALKVVGREAATERKLRGVELVAALRERRAETSEEAEVAALARGLRDREELRDEGSHKSMKPLRFRRACDYRLW